MARIHLCSGSSSFFSGFTRPLASFWVERPGNCQVAQRAGLSGERNDAIDDLGSRPFPTEFINARVRMALAHLPGLLLPHVRYIATAPGGEGIGAPPPPLPDFSTLLLPAEVPVQLHVERTQSTARTSKKVIIVAWFAWLTTHRSTVQTG